MRGTLCEYRDMVVAQSHPISVRSIVQRTIDRFGSKKCFAVWFYESHRTLELSARNFRKLVCDFLVSDVTNLACSHYAPAFDPAHAKVALAVPDQERL